MTPCSACLCHPGDCDTGADALSQGIECYLINGFKPTSDTLALKAIEVIGQYLPRAFANGQDSKRSAMLWAATTVGWRSATSAYS